MSFKTNPALTALAVRLSEFNKQMSTAHSALQVILLEKRIASTKKEIEAITGEDSAENFNELSSKAEDLMEKAIAEHIAKHKTEKTLSTDEYLKRLKEAASKHSEFSFDVETTEIEEGEEDPDSITTTELTEEISAEVVEKEKFESFSLNITLNEKQRMGAEMAAAGKSYVMIGPAGSGKTTAQRAVAEQLLLSHSLSTTRFKSYDADGKAQFQTAPSIAFVTFTRRAAANLRKAVFKSPLLEEKLRHNVMTIHALLEFIPETYEDYNEEGKLVEKFRFAPQRHAGNPLNITHLVIEEASMLDAYVLWRQLYDALPPGIQIILLGDINQLPPVFGPSILNYALVQLPIVELTEVYRNQGIVLENAHNILKGNSIVEHPDFVVIKGKSQAPVGQERMARALGDLFNQWLDVTGNDGFKEYDPDDCIILSPWNKQDLGTDNLNKWIAQHLGTRRGAIVHEIISGFEKLYLAVGDRVMVNRMDGTITAINHNSAYHGRTPQHAGKDLTRFGIRILGESDSSILDEPAGLDYSTFSLEALESQKESRKQQASHIVEVLLDSGQTEVLSCAGDFNSQNFSLGYALTVHKAQGSEWRKVFIILHKDHAVSLYRELFYTAVTRARTKVTIIAKDAVIEKAIKNQRIKGESIADKIEYFNAGIMGKDDGKGDIVVLK